MALALEYIRPVQCRATHAYANAIRRWEWRHLNFADFKAFHSSVGNNCYCFHGAMVNRKRKMVNGKW